VDDQKVAGCVPEADDAYVVVVGVEHQIARLGFAPGDGFAIAVLSISPVGAERSESRKSRASFWKSGKP